MLKKAAALLCVCVCTAAWISCGSATSHYVYAAISGASQIVVFREDPNSGVLTAITGSPFTAGSGAHGLALHPSKKFLYVANSGESDISLFKVSSGGVLTEVTPRTAAGITPVILAMDSAGSFLFAANVGSNNISAYSIDSGTGALTPVSGSPFPVGTLPLNMTVSSSGSVVYVSCAGSPGTVQAFSVDFSVTPAKLTPLNGSPYQAGTNPTGLTIDPSGTHLYTANTGDNSISEFSIGSDGTLTEILGSPIGETFTAPLALLVDPSGKYLFVANEGSNNVAAYTIDSGGALTILTNSPFGSGAEPSFLAADPNGKYLLVGSQSGAAIQVFTLDPSTGTLTSVGTNSTGSTPTSIVVTQ
jgi:6-phosphogluconolactonase (cycloisomerase 2 family)